MMVPFETLPDEARVWIYPAHRPFSENEKTALEDALTQFLSQWTAHNQTLEAAFDLPYNQESVQASGCSIDASVRFIQEVEKQFDLVLLDKMNVTFRQGAFLAHKPLNEFVKMAKAHAVSKETIVFNNLVDTVGDYRQFWEIPAGESWHSRFIK